MGVTPGRMTRAAERKGCCTRQHGLAASRAVTYSRVCVERSINRTGPAVDLLRCRLMNAQP